MNHKRGAAASTRRRVRELRLQNPLTELRLYYREIELSLLISLQRRSDGNLHCNCWDQPVRNRMAPLRPIKPGGGLPPSAARLVEEGNLALRVSRVDRCRDGRFRKSCASDQGRLVQTISEFAIARVSRLSTCITSSSPCRLRA